MSELTQLLSELRTCRACLNELPHEPHPVVCLHPEVRLLIIGQAPGLTEHQTGLPWTGPSGKRLRQWLGLSEAAFFQPEKIGQMPMGFCYPGRGASGDLPPVPRCSQLWHHRLHPHLPQVQLTLLIGQYAQQRYLGKARKASLTETVRAWQDYQPQYLPLPHPSPLNAGWLKRNTWFETEVLPEVRARVQQILQ